MKVFYVPNLDRYQHYKDRNIIWVKLYVDILQDHKFQQLKDNERWAFIGFILLAVKNNNEIPADFRYISRNILFSSRGLSEIVIKLLDLKLLDSKRIASRKQNDCLDKIREDKIRKEKTKLVLILKDWNERQSSPIKDFKPQNIINKYGEPKIRSLLEKYGQENNGLSKFLGALKENQKDYN